MGTVTAGAIVFTDMVGSTELRARLGAERAEQLRRDHDTLLARVVTACDGTVLRWTGDGVKAAFPNASSAITAAVAIQQAVAEYRSTAKAVAAFDLRVGLSFGEVLVEDGDHHGVAVIEAARLEALARPGEILATEITRVLAARHPNVVFESLGPKLLKGFTEPVIVHRVVDLAARPLPPLPPHLTSDSTPLVGRRSESAAFAAQWASSRGGGGGVVLLTGESGLGKSKLLSAFAATAHDGGAIVLAGGCSPDASIPYEPFVSALTAAAPLDATVEAALREPSTTLARLFPGSTAGHTDTQPSSARSDLFDAVSAVLVRLSRIHPVLLVVDDLHHASSSTMLLFQHVIETVLDERVVIVAAAQHGTEQLNLPPDAAVAALDVFSEAELVELIAVVAPQLSPLAAGEIAQRLQHDTAGSPAYAVALLEHLVNGSADQQIPESIQALVLARFAALPDLTRQLLTTGAVAGQTFDLAIVAAASDCDADQAAVEMTRSEVRQLVTETAPGQFSFAQSIVRIALLGSLDDDRRSALHRRLADQIARCAPDQFDELARHWRGAGDELAAAQQLSRAARRDMVALAYESARAKSHEVVETMSRSTDADGAMRAEAWLNFGAAQRALGEPTYTQAIIRAARLATSVGRNDLAAEAAALSTWPGTFFFVAEEIDNEMVELCERALLGLSMTDPVRVRVLATLASHLTFSNDRQRRLALVAEARMLADTIGEPLLIAHVLNAEFMCMWEPATLERRQQIGRELARIARATGDVETEFLSGFFLAFCHAEAGDLPLARRELVELLPVAETTRNAYFMFLAERLMLSIDIACGASDCVKRVDQLAHRYGATHADTDGTWALQTGALAYQAGTLGEMVNVVQAMTTGQQARTWLAALALAQLWAGDQHAALAVLERQGTTPRNYFWMTVTQVQAEVAVVVGDDATRRRLFDELLPYRGRVGITASGSLCFGLVSRTLGELASSLGQHAMAVELLIEAVAHADRIGMTAERVIGRVSLATTYRAMTAGGVRCEALLESTVAEAASLAAAAGMARHARLLEALSEAPGQ